MEATSVANNGSPGARWERVEMVEFFMSGGWSMFLVIGLGAVSLLASIAFARRPRAGDAGVLRGFSTATTFAVLGGVAANLGTVFSQVPQNPEWAHSPDLALIVMTGLGESLAPAILGFSLLALAWMVAAVGARRLGTQLAEA